MRFYYPSKPNRITIDSQVFLSCEADPNFILQIKKNGWRIQIHKDCDAVEFYTRHNKRLEPIVADADWDLLRQLVLDNIKADSAIIDGEFLHRRGESKNKIYMWDIFELNGEQQKKPYKQRKQILDCIIIPTEDFIVAKDFYTGFEQVWNNLVNPAEDEGIVIKDLRENLRVAFSKMSNDKSPRQFKILLDDIRNKVA